MANAIVEERVAPANDPWANVSRNLVLVRAWLEEDRRGLLESNCDAWRPGEAPDPDELDPAAAPLVARVEALLAGLDQSTAFINSERCRHE